MSVLTTVVVVLALLGSALISGVFFAFSSFIMTALARVSVPDGMAVMQSINVAVLNRSFLGLFSGTTVIAGLLGVLAIAIWGTPPAPYYLAGAFLYLVGTLLVTGLGNVPLNRQLAAAAARSSDAVALWQHYLDRWTRLNTLRTVAAAAAAVMFTLGLMQRGGG